MMVIYISIMVIIYVMIIKICWLSWLVGFLISVYLIFIRSYIDMFIKERNFEGKFLID